MSTVLACVGLGSFVDESQLHKHGSLVDSSASLSEVLCCWLVVCMLVEIDVVLSEIYDRLLKQKLNVKQNLSNHQ